MECRKDGIVNNLTPESLDQPTGTQKWEKCRLCLVKAVGGFMLEFYMPPKAAKVGCKMFRCSYTYIHTYVGENYNLISLILYAFSHVVVSFVS